MAEYVSVVFAGSFVILGVVLGAAAAILMRKLARASGLVAWAEANPDYEKLVKRSANFIIAFVSVIIVLLFSAEGLKVLELDILSRLLEVLTQSIQRWIVAFVVLIAGVYVAKIAKTKILETPIEYNQHAAVLVQFVLIITFALTALEIGGIPMTAFMELYKVALYTLGIMVALIVGIPIGLSLGPKVEKATKKKK